MNRMEFRHSPSYASRPGGVSLPVVLKSGRERSALFAFIDTGASNCAFERSHGELLGLDIEAGDRKIFSTAAGPVETFGHLVTIEALGLSFESLVFFFAERQVKKNLLGRTGWLDRIRFGLVDYEQTLYLAEYDFEAPVAIS